MIPHCRYSFYIFANSRKSCPLLYICFLLLFRSFFDAISLSSLLAQPPIDVVWLKSFTYVRVFYLLFLSATKFSISKLFQNNPEILFSSQRLFISRSDVAQSIHLGYKHHRQHHHHHHRHHHHRHLWRYLSIIPERRCIVSWIGQTLKSLARYRSSSSH